VATRATALKEVFEALPHIKKIGAKHIWFDFDEEADVLYISLERPQNATDTDVLENGVFLRLRGKKIVGITITNMSEKIKKKNFGTISVRKSVL
jgi:uncharacterized protein YuzE